VNVVFATCDHQPLITPDDQPLADALHACGVTVTPIPWTELDPFALLDAPPILLRSTWDYHRMPTMFTSWLRALEESGRRCWNPPAVARDNVDKVYLEHLAASGVPIPKTQWLDRIDGDVIRRALDDEGWPRAILKPRIAATAYGTFLVDRDSALSEEDLAPARSAGALLQEVIPEVIEHGEMSLVYFDGVFSHAVVKRAKHRDFRVQKDFGGRVDAVTPSATALAFADTVMAQVPATCLYARVDLVETARGPLLMELELIEPELYFLVVPEAAARFARLIADRVHT
jgi:glutathione synthase/RimK-type ligase-like ATP-grasp enzyme